MRQRYRRGGSCSSQDERGPDCMQEQKLCRQRGMDGEMSDSPDNVVA